jgi:hypothetical protein
MMGEQTGIQPKIFYPHLNLEQRVPKTHLLRRIQEQIDFNFIYAEVRDSYGSNGMERALAGTDTGVPGLCCPEHPSLAEVRILSQDKSIGHDGADQGGYSRSYKVFFRLYGADELKNQPKGAIWLCLPRLSVIRGQILKYSELAF